MNNASKFDYNYYFDELESIIPLCISSYYGILQNEKIFYTALENKTFVVVEEKNEKPEEYIRTLFLKYLRKYKKSFGISYKFYPEVGQTNKSFNRVSGYHDIFIIGLENILAWDVDDEEIYLSFECKRLNKAYQDVNEYVINGIKRYSNADYSAKMPVAGMIAFIEEGEPQEYKNEINSKLKTNKTIKTKDYLTNIVIDRQFDYCYLSEHYRQNSDFNTINLYHLFFQIENVIFKTENKKNKTP